MKVIALENGFFGGAPIDKGAQFEVPDGRKAAWYAPVAGATLKSAKTAPTKEVSKALSEMGTDKAKSFVDVHTKPDLA